MRRLAVTLAIAAISGPALAVDQAILIFGGKDHDTFLGCLNCSEADSSSVWNDSSDFGWANKYGKWEPYGDFGGKYSDNSACSQYANHPPILVDRQGRAYGYLTVNEYHKESVCGFGGSEQICAALKVMCAHA